MKHDLGLEAVKKHAKNHYLMWKVHSLAMTFQFFDTYTVCFGINELKEPPWKQQCTESSERDSDGAITHWCSVHPTEYKLQQQPQIKSGPNKGNSRPAKRVESSYGAFHIKITQRLAYDHFLLDLANKLNTSSKYLNKERMEFWLGSSWKDQVDGEDSWSIFWDKVVQQVCKKKSSVEIEVWREAPRKRVQATEPVCFSSLLHVLIVSQIVR